MSEINEIVFGERTLIENLARITALAAIGFAGCDCASLRLRTDHNMPMVVGSDLLATALESLQSELGEGPCVSCLDEQKTQSIASVVDDLQWQSFAVRALAEGLGSCLAVPLGMIGTFEGALNFYWEAPQVFSNAQWQMATSITYDATPTVANAIEMSSVATEVARLLLELERGDDLLAQALGVLQARHDVTTDEAHRRLQEIANTAGLSINDVARQVTGTNQI